MTSPAKPGGPTNPPPAKVSPLVKASRFAPLQHHTVADFIARGCDGRLTPLESGTLTHRIHRALGYYPNLAAAALSCPVIWNAGLKTSAGRFVYDGSGRIELHPGLRREAASHTVDTLLHELAHGLAWWRHHRDCGHDLRWFEMMFLLALDPLTHRTHDLPACRTRSQVELTLADLEHDLALESGDTP